MEKSTSAVLTHVRGERGSPERGFRSWSYAEIRDECWYQVETCAYTNGKAEISTLIIADLREALQMLTTFRQNTWTAFRLYCRLPLLAEKGFVFETIRKVFSDRDGTHLFELECGLMLFEKKGSNFSKAKLGEMREIYCRDARYV